MYGFDTDTVYLCPAPLYHAAPLRFGSFVHALGGTVVVMPSFDPVDALAAIERHRVTHSQWVPTMFVRMLKLPGEQREAFDLSSHRVAIHAAAPCPVEVKQRMIDWWGPILLRTRETTVHLPQRPGQNEDGAAPRARELDDHRRYRLERRS
jgi:fatty-acyl-CoA synthase